MCRLEKRIKHLKVFCLEKIGKNIMPKSIEEQQISVGVFLYSYENGNSIPGMMGDVTREMNKKCFISKFAKDYLTIGIAFLHQSFKRTGDGKSFLFKINDKPGLNQFGGLYYKKYYASNSHRFFVFLLGNESKKDVKIFNKEYKDISEKTNYVFSPIVVVKNQDQAESFKSKLEKDIVNGEGMIENPKISIFCHDSCERDFFLGKLSEMVPLPSEKNKAKSGKIKSAGDTAFFGNPIKMLFPSKKNKAKSEAVMSVQIILPPKEKNSTTQQVKKSSTAPKPKKNQKKKSDSSKNNPLPLDNRNFTIN